MDCSGLRRVSATLILGAAAKQARESRTSELRALRCCEIFRLKLSAAAAEGVSFALQLTVLFLQFAEPLSYRRSTLGLTGI